ncbi:MAG: YajQ family cyclic di-GMP-binding protein [Myxococcaceae bacterium]
MPSFDVVSKIDLQELDNAINQTRKEISTRYDFQGTHTVIELTPDKGAVMLKTADPDKLKAAREMLLAKMSKRGIPLRGIKFGDEDSAALGQIKQALTLQQGISVEKSKELIKLLKDSKLKVQGSIQGDSLRITGKNKDDLQEAIALFRKNADVLAIDMQFNNFRD